jgi:hypothetical protein
MTPTLGRVVHYKLTEQDAVMINRRRDDFDAFRLGDGRGKRGTGHVAHVGNTARGGDVYPAIVVRTFDPTISTCNLQVFLDGNDAYWATSRVEGDEAGQWTWPSRI